MRNDNPKVPSGRKNTESKYIPKVAVSTSQHGTAALILAGGLGTRLRGVVDDVPKSLASVGGRPFVHWLLDRLADSGVGRVVLATGYRGDMVREACGNSWRGMALDYSQESTPLGTGGALAVALNLVDTDSCLVINGDTWLDLDYRLLCRAGEGSGLPLYVTLTKVPSVARYGAATVDGDRLIGFSEKGHDGAGLINAGVYWVSTKLQEYFPRRLTFSLEEDLLPLLVEKRLVGAFIAGSGFIDIGVPSDYFKAQSIFASL